MKFIDYLLVLRVVEAGRLPLWAAYCYADAGDWKLLKMFPDVLLFADVGEKMPGLSASCPFVKPLRLVLI